MDGKEVNNKKQEPKIVKVPSKQDNPFKDEAAIHEGAGKQLAGVQGRAHQKMFRISPADYQKLRSRYFLAPDIVAAKEQAQRNMLKQHAQLQDRAKNIKTGSNISIEDFSQYLSEAQKALLTIPNMKTEEEKAEAHARHLWIKQLMKEQEELEKERTKLNVPSPRPESALGFYNGKQEVRIWPRLEKSKVQDVQESPQTNTNSPASPAPPVPPKHPHPPTK